MQQELEIQKQRLRSHPGIFWMKECHKLGGEKNVSSHRLISVPTRSRVSCISGPYLQQVTESGDGDLLSWLEAEGVLAKPEEVE